MSSILSPEPSQISPGPIDFRFATSPMLLEAIVESSDDAIITQDLSGTVTSWNPAATRIFGYQPGEIIGSSILRLTPARLQHEEAELLHRLRSGEIIRHYETLRLTRQGSEFLASLTVSAVKDASGQIVGVSKIARDITAERHSDQLRSRLSAIVESSDDAILSKDLDGTLTSWNRAAQRIFGYSESEMLGKSILMLIPQELYDEEKDIVAKLRAGQRIDHFETVRLKQNGERIDVSLTISPVKDASGTIIGASKILRDITQRKRLEQSLFQAEKLAAGGKMAATIAHEINNPLEAILNLVYLARTNCTDPVEVESFLRTAESELERLSHIARQTLGFYRENASPVLYPLADLVRDALKIYAPKLKHSGIRMEAKLASTRPIVMRKGEVMQVISNLIANAVYAMPDGGTLIVTLDDASLEGIEGLALAVADTGCGIAPQHLQKIFEAFFTTRGSIGTGIGLWVAREFIEGHAGTIEVQSSTDPVSHGTTLSIFLPLENPHMEAA